MAQRLRHPHFAAAAIVCGVALLVLVMRAGALRAGAIGSGGAELAAIDRATGQRLQSSMAPTATLEPKAYFPILAHSWFEEITASENFEPPVIGWPEGSVRNVVSVREEFNYGPYVDPDKQTVYQVGIRDNDDHVFLTGPLFVLKDFQYQAWMRRKSCKTDQAFEYGILISPTPIDPAHPEAEDVITFQNQIGFTTGGWWWVKRWDVDSVGQADAVEKIDNDRTSALTEECNIWNVMRIERSGNTLTFKVTNEKRGIDDFQTVATYTPGPGDPPLHDQYYVGFFAAHPGITTWRYYQYDNVYVHAAP
jgi:hypothetical protein